MCVRLLKRDFPALTCFLGPWAETEHWQKWTVFLHYVGCDCRRAGGGRCPVLCVQLLRGQSITCTTCEIPGSSLKPRDGSLENWAAPVLTHTQCPGGMARCAPQPSGGSHARPDVCSCTHTPSTAACRMLPLRMPDRPRNEASTTALYLPSIWPGHSRGIDSKEHYSCQLQVASTDISAGT